jgi:serine/threonine protein kinase
MLSQEEFRNRYRFDPNRDYIGGGGFGKVYRAYDFVKRHYVAIKVSEVKHEWKHFTLQREVEIVNKMPLHQNIARYDSCHRFDMGMVGTMDFAVLKYYENGNLEKFLQNHSLSELETEQVIRGILEGIVFLHKYRIIHRDLKAQNILIDREDGIWVPKITDFGLSRQVTQESTGTNSVVGITFVYAAPEQIQNRPIQQNVDLWAAGVIMYRMIAGELPFKSGDKTEDVNNTESQMNLCRKITDGELPEKLKSLPEPYKTLISKCLVVDTKQRVQHAEDLLHFLDTYEPPSQLAPKEIPVVDAPASSEPTTIWTADSVQSSEHSAPKINTEAATKLVEPKTAGKPTASANATEQPTFIKNDLDNFANSKDNFDKPTVLKDNLGSSTDNANIWKENFDKPTVLKDNFGTSAEKPTVLKENFDKPTVLKDNFGTSADKPTVLKDNFDKPTVLKDNLDKPTVLKDNFDKPTVLKDNDAPTRILPATPKTVEQQDDLKKQVKLWGSIAAAVCLVGGIIGYCNGQKNKKLAAVTTTVTVTDTTKTQPVETAQITTAPIPDTTAAITATAPTSVPATPLTSTTSTAKKTEKDKPKPSKPATATPQTAPHNSEWPVAPAPAPATPTKPVTPEPTHVEPVKTEPAKPVLASSLDNMSDFTGEKGLIYKHLNKIDCNNFTVSFIIKANGMIADPQWVKGDEKCKNAALSQVRSMPQLKTPISDKKPADYKYFFTKRQGG